MNLPTPQCSSGTTQSGPFPTRAVKVRQVRGTIKPRAARAASAGSGKGQNPNGDRARFQQIEVDFRKLPTSFRVPYSVSVDVSVRDLLTTLHREHGVNVSKEIEPLIKKWAARTARRINERRR